MVTSGLNKILGQLEIAQNFDRNFTAKCHCDEAIKELRRLPRKKKEKVQIFRRPKIGGQMGLDKIRALARDPFAFMWNVRHFTIWHFTLWYFTIWHFTILHFTHLAFYHFAFTLWL